MSPGERLYASFAGNDNRCCAKGHPKAPGSDCSWCVQPENDAARETTIGNYLYTPLARWLGQQVRELQKAQKVTNVVEVTMDDISREDLNQVFDDIWNH